MSSSFLRSHGRSYSLKSDNFGIIGETSRNPRNKNDETSAHHVVSGLAVEMFDGHEEHAFLKNFAFLGGPTTLRPYSTSAFFSTFPPASSTFGAHINSIFLRTVYLVTQESHGFLDQNIIGPEQAAPIENASLPFDCRPQSHVTLRHFFERLDSSFDGYTNRAMKQGDTTTQLSGFAVTQQLILGELDTEIRVRERLQEAVESRIAWATCLQSSLGAVTEKHGTSVCQRRGGK
jgi:hypothetical protein